MSNLQVFKNEIFEVSIQLDSGEVLFDVETVARSLGFTQIKANKEYIRWETVNRYLNKYVSQEVGKGDFIPEPMVYKLAFKASNEIAEKFQDWLAIDVLPAIRKEGAYITNKADPQKLRDRAKEIDIIKQQEVEARLNNSRARQASVLLKIANDTEIKEYKQVLHSYASKIVTGEQILPLPIADKKTYSATEIGDRLGITANMVGRLANANGLKTSEHGKLFYDKSAHSNKQVETFRYYDSVIPVLEKLSKGAC